MALQLRRGTNAQRLGMTPANGELIFVTDYLLTTVSVTAINTSTNTLSISSGGVAEDQQIKFIDDTQNGLIKDQVYYVLNAGVSGVPFQVSLTLNGSPVDITGSLAAPIQFAETPTLANEAPIGTSVSPLWIGDGTTVGGVIAGALNLDDLLDVQIAGTGGVALENYQHLQYDSADQLWRNVSNVVVPGTLNVFGNTTLGDASGDSVTFNASTVATPNNLNFDSGTLFIDAANNRIGINNPTPTQPLDVSGNGQFSGAIYGNNTDQATTAYTGSIQTLGGIGVVKNAFIGGAIYGNNTDNATTAFTGGIQTLGGIGVAKAVFAGGKITTADGTQSTTPSTGALIVGGGAGIGGNLSVGGAAYVNNTDNATTTTTGSIQTLGGIGVVKDIFAGGVITTTDTTDATNQSTGSIVTAGGVGIAKKLHVGSNISVDSTTNATSGTTGSIQTDGGVGIAQDLFVAGSTTITGDLTVNGTTTTINTQNLLVEDKNIEMGVVAVPTDVTADGGGIILKGTTDKTILYDNALGAWVSNIGFNTNGSTLGNITVGVVDDNTISTTTGDLAITAAGTGNVTITSGTTTPTTITRTSTGTTTNVRAVILNSQSTGTPVVGFGTSAEFQVETAPGNTESAGYISVTSTDITPGSEDFKMSFGLMAAGATYTEVAALSSVGDLQIDGDLTVTGNNIKSSSATALTLSGDDVTVVGDLGVGGGTVASSQTTVNLFNTTTTTLNIGGAATTVAIGAATGTTTIGNDLAVNGNTTLGTNSSDTVTVNGLVTDNIIFSFNDTATPRGILGQMSNGAADYWFIGGAEAGGVSDAGFAMIATGDNGHDPIYARQYNGSPLSGTIAKELALLDGSGNTVLPGDLTVTGNDIKSSTGAAALTFDDINVKVNGELTITGNTIRSSGGSAFPAGTTAITLSGANVTVAGNLDVNGAVAIDSRADIDTATLTTTAITQVPLITSTRNVMKCVVYIVQGADVHTVEALVLRTGVSTAMVTTYSEMYNTSSLATFAADTSGGAIRLLVTPANTTSMLFTSVITSLT